MNLLTRLLSRQGEVARFNISEYLSQWSRNSWNLNQPLYPSAVSYSHGKPTERVENSFTGYVYGAYKSNPIVFGCMQRRSSVFSQARPMWRHLVDGRPGDLFHDDGLSLLEKPWPNGSSGELLRRMIQDVDLSGNAYIANEGDRLRRLRPDWVQIILTGNPLTDPDIDIFGYVYTPGGPDHGDGVPYLPDQICRWSPDPDPIAFYRGQSWITSAVREIQADQAAVEHKLKFFEQGATLGPIITAPPGMTMKQFKDFLEAADSAHEGVINAHKTLYLAGGADVKVTRASWAQTDFTATQGKAETRICLAAGVPAVILGASEGLQGSSLNAGNYNASKRSFVEATVMDLWRTGFSALSTILTVPDSAELWFDEEDLPYLRQDQQDEATILQAKATAINTFVTAGYTQDSAVIAGATSDVTKLKSTGLVSVQLLPPGQSGPDASSGSTPPDNTPPDGGGGGNAPDDNTPDSAARSVFDDLEDEVERAFNPDQLRGPHGKWIKTEFLHKAVDGIREAIKGSSTSVDRRGVHVTAPVRGERVTVTLSPLDIASLALLAVPGPDAFAAGTTGLKVALVIRQVRRALQLASAAQTAAQVAHEPARSYTVGDLLDEDEEDLDDEDLEDDDDDETAPDEAGRALLDAIDDAISRAYNPDQARIEKGHVGGGRFGSKLTDALEAWLRGDGPDDPLAGVTRPTILKAAKDRGIHVPPRMSLPALKSALLESVREEHLTGVHPSAPDTSHRRFSIDHNGKRIDVGVSGLKSTGQVYVHRESDSGRRGARVTPNFAHMGELSDWARQNGHHELADYAAAEHAAKPATLPDAHDPAVDALAARDGVSPEMVARAREIMRQKSDLPMLPIVTNVDEFSKPWVYDRNNPGFAELEKLYNAHPALYNAIARERQVEQTWQDYGRKRYPGKTMDEAKAEAADALRQAVDGSPIIVRRGRESTLRDILQSGRMKTQFETGESSGLLDTQARKRLEDFTFGLPKGTPDSERPVYGIVSPNGIRAADEKQAVDGYGDIQLVLKPSVRDRTTVTVGDSLKPESYATRPAPINNPDWRAAGPNGIKNLGDSRFESKNYIEAQVAGGVKVGDIEQVVFAREPEPSTVAALDAARVPWQVLKKGSGAKAGPKADAAVKVAEKATPSVPKAPVGKATATVHDDPEELLKAESVADIRKVGRELGIGFPQFVTKGGRDAMAEHLVKSLTAYGSSGRDPIDEIREALAHVKPPVPSSPTAKATLSDIRNAASRADAETLLKPHSKAELQGLAKELNAPFTTKATKPTLTAMILDEIGHGDHAPAPALSPEDRPLGTRSNFVFGHAIREIPVGGGAPQWAVYHDDKRIGYANSVDEAQEMLRQASSAKTRASLDKVTARQAEVESAVVDAFHNALKVPNRDTRHFGAMGGVDMTQLRAQLGDRYTRAEVDAALTRLNRTGAIALLPQENQKTLTAKDRADAVLVGGRPYHALMAEGGQSPAKTPAETVVANMRAELSQRRMVDLRKVAKWAGISISWSAVNPASAAAEIVASRLRAWRVPGESDDKAAEGAADELRIVLREIDANRNAKRSHDPDDDEAIRALGHDTTPGHDELHHYWTVGPGLAKWRGSPHEFTTLRDLLAEHVPPEQADRMAADWVHEVTGAWPGSDLHRVEEGGKPRGDRVGPG